MTTQRQPIGALPLPYTQHQRVDIPFSLIRENNRTRCQGFPLGLFAANAPPDIGDWIFNGPSAGLAGYPNLLTLLPTGIKVNTIIDVGDLRLTTGASGLITTTAGTVSYTHLTLPTNREV